MSACEIRGSSADFGKGTIAIVDIIIAMMGRGYDRYACLSFAMLRSGRPVALALLLLSSLVAVAQCDMWSAITVTNAPYSAARHVITVQHKPDGTSSRLEATEQEARDSKGRIYRAGERHWTTLVDGKPTESSETLVRISDPVANTETKWDTTGREVQVVHYPPPKEASGDHSNVGAFSFDQTAKRLNGKTLGTRTIEGLSVEGIGYKTSSSAHECWFSPELKIRVLRTDVYPDHSYTDQLGKILQGEPDVSRFKPPTEYPVKHVYVGESGANSK